MKSVWLHRYAVLVSLGSLFLVVTGASVTSHEEALETAKKAAALASHQGHALTAIPIGILLLGLVIWLWTAKSPGRLKGLGLCTLVLFVIEGGLGSAGGSGPLSPVLGFTHALLAQLFFIGTVAIALVTSPGWHRGPEMVDDYGWPSTRSMGIGTPVVVLIQVMLGAAYRHRAIGVLWHLMGAIVVVIVVLIVCACITSQYPKHRALSLSAKILMGITFFQVALGFGVLSLQSMGDTNPLTISTISHVTTGALTLASSLVLGILIRRNVREKVKEPEGSEEAVTS